MKFQYLDVVLHVKTNKKYLIMATPSRVKLEADVVPAYIYTDEERPGTSTLWVHSQESMEDGRFTLVERRA